MSTPRGNPSLPSSQLPRRKARGTRSVGRTGIDQQRRSVESRAVWRARERFSAGPRSLPYQRGAAGAWATATRIMGGEHRPATRRPLRTDERHTVQPGDRPRAQPGTGRPQATAARRALIFLRARPVRLVWRVAAAVVSRSSPGRTGGVDARGPWAGVERLSFRSASDLDRRHP